MGVVTKNGLRAACVEIAPDFVCLRRHHPKLGPMWAATCTYTGVALELSLVESEYMDAGRSVLEQCLVSLRGRARNVQRSGACPPKQ